MILNDTRIPDIDTKVFGLSRMSGHDMRALYREPEGETPVFAHIDSLAVTWRAEEDAVANMPFAMVDWEEVKSPESKVFNIHRDDYEARARFRFAAGLRTYKEANAHTKVGIYVSKSAERRREKGELSWWGYWQWQQRQREWTQFADVLYVSVYRPSDWSVERILQYIDWQKAAATIVHGKPVYHYTWHRYSDTHEVMPMDDYRKILTACGDCVLWESARYRAEDPNQEWLEVLQELA